MPAIAPSTDRRAGRYCLRLGRAAGACSGQPLAAKTLIEEMLCLVEQALTPALDANTAAAIVAANYTAPLSARYQHHEDTPCILS